LQGFIKSVPALYENFAVRCALWMLLACSTACAQHSRDDVIAAQLDSVIAGLPAEARAVALRIPELGSRLLATRAYLRAGASLSSRWSWSEAQSVAFAASPAGDALRVAIDAVRCAFETRNPGHSLFVNPSFRSVEIQLQRWNGNESVARASARLLGITRDAIGGPAGRAGRDSPAWLIELLRSHVPRPAVTLAAPGLSAHGRGSAIDFQVSRAGSIIAGPETSTVAAVWDAGGWTDRLGAAIDASGAPFDGPLESPHEPWHYSYVPTADPALLAGCAR
jgi:hypothetical protein